MKTKVISLLPLIIVIFFASCSKDEEPVTPVPPSNRAPVITNQTFTASEDIDDVTVIGSVVASDENKDDNLIFSITQNSNDVFEISETGTLSLANGSELDYESATSHSITVTVSDGKDNASATVAIEVSNVNELPAGAVAAFEFNQNYSDALQMNTDLIPNGNITFTTDRFGNDNAILLDGQEDTKLTLTNTDDNNIGVNKESYSISVWYRTETPFSTFTSARIIEKWSGSPRTSYPVSMIFVDSTLGVHQYDKTTRVNIATTAVVSNDWTHLVMIYNGDTDELLAYKNGTLIDQIDVSSLGEIDNNADYIIGNTANGIRPFSGAIDDLYIYKRALSNNEVVALFTEINN